MLTAETKSVLWAACHLAGGRWREHFEQIREVAQCSAHIATVSDLDLAERQSLFELRAKVIAVWSLSRQEDRFVADVNVLMRETQARPRLTHCRTAGGWQLGVAPSESFVTGLGAAIAMALAHTVRGGELHRLKRCAAPGCAAIFVDVSRNGSRLFCNVGNCASKHHSAAYRKRVAERRSPEDDCPA